MCVCVIKFTIDYHGDITYVTDNNCVMMGKKSGGRENLNKKIVSVATFVNYLTNKCRGRMIIIYRNNVSLQKILI